MRNIEDILQGINIGIAVGLALNENKTETLELYKNIMQHSILPSENLVSDCAKMLREHANRDFEEKKYNLAVLEYLDIFKNATLEPEEYKKVAVCLFELGQIEAGIGFLDLYEKACGDKYETQKDIGWLYFSVLKDYEKAIYHYKEAIKICNADPELYNTLGHIYVLFYKDKNLEEQYECFSNAHNLRKNTRLYIRNIIFTLYRMGDWQQVEEFYKKLLNLNPTHADYYYYGCFLISQKRFKEGYKYLQHRFEKEDGERSIIPSVLPPEKYWQGQDLTGKKILVHCEQGFGDSIMYSRFVKLLSKYAQKVYFIVQDELFDLMNNSNLGAEVYSTNFELAKLEYDYFTTTLDLPLYLNVDPENIPFKDGYLHNTESVNKTSKIKIGFAYKGNEQLKSCERDIPFEFLAPLFLLEDCEFYSLQVDGDVTLPPHIVDLGVNFKSFEDTQKAISDMDLVISTDNVILNLAGAMGKKTFGLFNRFVEYRWFDLQDEKNCPWYQSVKVFKNSVQDGWEDTVSRLLTEINRIKEGLKEK